MARLPRNVTYNDGLFEYLRCYKHDVHGLIRNISNLLQIIRYELKESNMEDLMQHIDSALASLSVLNDWNSILINFQALTEDLSCELSSVISRIRIMLSSQLTYRKCKIELDKKIPAIAANSIDILRVFKNLIENSMKYALVEELIINITLKSVDENFFVIEFSDNGNPLPKYVQESITYTLKGNRSDSLGLPIVVEILEKHKGSIKLVATKKGCVFNIKLPIHKESYEI